MPRRPAQAVIVDEQEIFRRGLRDLLEETGEFVVVGEGDSVAAGRMLMETLRPDVGAVELCLPDGDGLQLIRECHASRTQTVCLLLDDHPSERTKLSAVLLGGVGVLDRSDRAEAIVEAVRAAVLGRDLLGSHAVEDLLEDLEHEPPAGDLDRNLTDLTPQERRVFELVGQGLTNRAVGERLHLTEKTVKNYLTRILAKLGMRRRTEVAMLATRLAVRTTLGPESP